MSRLKTVAVALVGFTLLSTGVSFADSGAVGAAWGSPGILSGNVIQVPVNAPVNLCGNTVNVIGLLNPALGNTCVNQ